ncbi:MAG: serine/threonine-protein kinase [Candidatus Obscuribacterales bacterium]|nr:serine/threonine-protein kinase [Candidatus Obscuribacterales bacterium]
MLEVGSIFAGRYEVLAKLGEGGMGAVYKVLDRELNIICALKLLQRDIVTSPEWRQRFLREGRAMSRIDHRNVARIYRLGIEGVPYLVMEFIGGTSLRKVLEQRESLPSLESLRLMQQVCDGMNAAHQSQVLHRDLKPDNIMMVSDGEADESPYTIKIVDFGLARFNSANQATKSQHLTQTGTLIGSVHYMSPEQCEGRRVDERSDVYSVGCVLFECLTGSAPYDADTTIGVLHKHRTEEIPWMDVTDKAVPSADLNAIVRKALAKQPAERYQTMAEMREDLALCMDQHPPKYATLQTQKRTPPYLQKVLLGLLVVTIFSGSIVFGFLVYKKLSKKSAVDTKIEEFEWSKAHRKSLDFASSTDLVQSAIQDADWKTSARDFTGAVRTLDRALGIISQQPEELSRSIRNIYKTEQINPHVGRLLAAKAEALQALGDKKNACLCAEDALIVTANSAPKYRELGDASNDAVKVLLANKVAYHFDDYDFNAYDYAAKTNLTNVIEALRQILSLSVSTGSRDLQRNILRLEEPYVAQSKNLQARAHYWLRVAVAAVPESMDQQIAGRRAADLYMQSGDNLAAAEAMGFLSHETYDQEKARTYVIEMKRLLSKVEPKDSTYVQRTSIMAAIAAHLIGTWRYDEAESFCAVWIPRCRKNTPYTVDLLKAYAESLRATNQSEKAIQFLHTNITRLSKKTDEPLRLSYMRALADLYYKLQRAQEAEKEYASVLRMQRANNSPQSIDQALLDLPYYLDCCACLNKRNAFNQAIQNFYSYNERFSPLLRSRMLDEFVRRDDFREIIAALQPSQTRARPKVPPANAYSDMLTTLAWHCAGIGAHGRARQFLPAKLTETDLGDNYYLTHMMIGNAELADKGLKRQLRDLEIGRQARFDERTNRTLVHLALARLLLGDPAQARLYLSQVKGFLYSGHDFEVTDSTIKQFLAAAEGRPEKALEVIVHTPALPTIHNCLAYQKFFMALIAKANGHESDIPLYLAAARKDLRAVLPPTHSVFELIDKRIVGAKQARSRTAQ